MWLVLPLVMTNDIRTNLVKLCGTRAFHDKDAMNLSMGDCDILKYQVLH